MGQGQPAPPNRRVKIGIDAGWVSEQAFSVGDQSLRASIQRQYPAPKRASTPRGKVTDGSGRRVHHFWRPCNPIRFGASRRHRCFKWGRRRDNGVSDTTLSRRRAPAMSERVPTRSERANKCVKQQRHRRDYEQREESFHVSTSIRQRPRWQKTARPGREIEVSVTSHWI